MKLEVPGLKSVFQAIETLSDSYLRRWSAWREKRRGVFILTRAIARFQLDQGDIHSATLAYFIFFSLFPLLLLMVSTLSFWLDPAEASKMAFQLLREFPWSIGQLVRENILSAIELKGPITFVSLLILLWSGSRIFWATSYALNHAWGVQESRSFIHINLVAIAVLFGSVLLVSLSVSLDAAANMLESILYKLGFGRLPLFSYYFGYTFSLLSLVSSFVLFVSIYWLGPDMRFHWRDIWPGALIASILWKLSKIGFAWYLTTLSDGTVIYGSIGTVMTLLMWLYISSIILFIGAEINRADHEWRNLSADTP